jgi:hypothetical protein
MRALVWKELREVAGITALALGAYLALVASLMGAKVFEWVPGLPRGLQAVPFDGCGFTEPFVIISVVFAVALGFRQSAWESVKGTYLYLLHLPVGRNAVFLTKLAVGISLVLACAAAAILAYAAWAAIPGSQPAPFLWALTTNVWQLALLMPLLYLGAFLSGLRPARWFGTRLLPLVAALAVLVFVANYAVWVVALPLGTAGYFLLVSGVCLVGRMRDYA